MAISTDTSINFSSSSGYTIYEDTAGDISFTAGTVTLGSGRVVTAAVRTPQLNVSSWGAIRDIAMTYTEGNSSGNLFYTKVLVSFDNWSGTDRQFYNTYIPGDGWIPLASFATSNTDLFATLRERGLSPYDLARINKWPDVSRIDGLSLLIGMTREASGANGNVDQVTVSYGSEVLAIKTTETSIGTLPIEPDFPIDIAYSASNSEYAYIGGYFQTIEESVGLRMEAKLKWSVLDQTDKITLITFLESGMNTHFDWQWRGLPASAKWKCIGKPRVTGVSKGYFSVEADLREHKQ